MIQSELCYAALERRGIILLTGPEAKEFLQGLISNDINKVSDTNGIYAALLTPQGKFLHDFLILQQGETLLLDCEGPRLADLGMRFGQYKLRAEVSLLDATEDYRVFALFGRNVDRQFGLPAGRGRVAELPGGGLIFRDPRHTDLGLRCLLPRTNETEVFSTHGFSLAAFSDYERHRLNLGIPDGSRDIEVGKALLMECNFEMLNGVDFEKGCYVGQELTARTKYRGTVRKFLRPVAIDGELPSSGTPIMADDRQAGEIRSGLDQRAIALLRSEHVEVVSAHNIQLTAGGSRVIPLPIDR